MWGSRQLVVAALVAVVLVVSACEVRPNMTPGAGGFFGMPWPNDIRVAADGTLDLDGYPGRWHPLVDIILRRGAATTRGFGANSPIFFTLTGLLDPASLPSPAASTATDSPVQLVNIDPASPAYGTRIPVAARFDAKPSFYKVPHTLSLLPYPGFVLEEGTRYAAVLLRGLRAPRGSTLEPASLLGRLDGPFESDYGLTEAEFDALRDQRDAVVEYLEAETSSSGDDLLAFTVFTTQVVTPTMEAMHATVEELPDPPIHEPTIVRDCTSADVAAVDLATDVPRFQAGREPYLDSGGDVVVDAGRAEVQFHERLPFRIAFPCGAAPADGWPIILHIDGTGSRYTAALTHFADRFYPDGDLRHLVISITPHMTEDRIPEGGSPLVDLLEGLGLPAEDLVNVYFFNFLNPIAGVNNQRQIAAEISYLKRVARTLELPSELVGAASDVTTDDERIAYYGHSHGAISGPIALAVDDEIDAALLSAGGAGFYHNLEHRGDVGPFVDQVLFLPKGEMDAHHPIAAAIQTLAEGGDTANYADDIDTPHLLLTSGFADGCTPRETAEHLAAAAGLPVAAPTIWSVPAIEELLGIEPEPLPLTANLPDGRTGALLQLDAGHFGVHANPEIVRTFFDTLIDTGTPTVTDAPLVPEDQTRCFRND